MTTANERLQDEYIAHALLVSQYGVGAARKVVAALNSNMPDMKAALAAALADMTPATMGQVSKLNRAIKPIIKLSDAVYKGAFKSLHDDLITFADHESEFSQSLYREILGETLIKRLKMSAPTGDQIYAAALKNPFQGKLLSDWSEDVADDAIAKIRNAISAGFASGKTTDEIVRGIIGTKAAGYQDGTLNANRANATSIVRTAISHVASEAKKKYQQRNEKLFKGKIWISTLDGRTTPECIIRDGKQYSLDNKPVGHNMPYGAGPGKLHFCCRSTETYIMKSFKDLGLDVDDITPETRASMDGQVPAETTFKEWIMRQSFERKVQAFGVTRAKLLENGDLTPDDLYNLRGKYLSLEELREIEVAAFNKAGL